MLFPIWLFNPFFGIPAGGSSGFHPIGINGGPSGANKITPDIEIGYGRNSGNKMMMKILSNLKKNNSGASAAEYALIVAVLGGFVVGGASLFGTGLRTAMGDAGTRLDTTVGTGALTNPT